MSNYTEREMQIARGARDYCEQTGSMYFEYTDASNELVDAFKAGVEYCESNLKNEKIIHLESEIERLKKDNEKYKNALEFYASPDFWHYDHITRDNVVIARCDRSKANDLTIVCSGGKLARKALSEVENDGR